MDNVKKVKKNPYLLLELLIAFFLLCLFLAPMLNTPFAFLTKQSNTLTQTYLEMEKQRLLFLIEEKIRTQEISWDTLRSAEKKPIILETKDVSLPEVPLGYRARLILSKATFIEEKDLCFGKVKVAVKIEGKKQKKGKALTIKPGFLSLFVLQKNASAPHVSNNT